MINGICADSAGATGIFVPLFTEEPEQTSRFAPGTFQGPVLTFEVKEQ